MGVLRSVPGILFNRCLTLQLSWTPRRQRLVLALLVIAIVTLTARQQFRAGILIAAT